MWFIPTLSWYITIDSQRCWTFPDLSNGLVLVLMACAVTAGAPPGLRWANTMDSSDSLADGNGCCHVTKAKGERNDYYCVVKMPTFKKCRPDVGDSQQCCRRKKFSGCFRFRTWESCWWLPYCRRWFVRAEKRKENWFWAFLLSIFSTQMAAVVQKIRNNNKKKI